jgi:hypothetical protein
MGNILVRDLSPVLDTAVRELSKKKSLSLSEAAKSLMHSGMAAKWNDGYSESGSALRLGDQLTKIFKGVFQTDAEHAEFEQSLESFRRAPDRRPVELE